jgi:hypothetical protein
MDEFNFMVCDNDLLQKYFNSNTLFTDTFYSVQIFKLGLYLFRQISPETKEFDVDKNGKIFTALNWNSFSKKSSFSTKQYEN